MLAASVLAAALAAAAEDPPPLALADGLELEPDSPAALDALAADPSVGVLRVMATEPSKKAPSLMTRT